MTTRHEILNNTGVELVFHHAPTPEGHHPYFGPVTRLPMGLSEHDDLPAHALANIERQASPGGALRIRRLL